MIKHRHGSPYDRGSADSYYRRGKSPHYYVGSSYSSERIERDRMTQEEIQEYLKGFEDQEKLGEYKIWDDAEGY